MSLKRRLDDNNKLTVRTVYNAEINGMPVAEAAVTVLLQAVERTLQRHKIHNRPPLPITRQEIVLTPAYTRTTDDRQFLLVDDGLINRMLVYGTQENLRR